MSVLPSFILLSKLTIETSYENLQNAKFISQELTTDATEDCHIMELKLLKPDIYHLFLCQLQMEIYNGDK